MLRIRIEDEADRPAGAGELCEAPASLARRGVAVLASEHPELGHLKATQHRHRVVVQAYAGDQGRPFLAQLLGRRVEQKAREFAADLLEPGLPVVAFPNSG